MSTIEQKMTVERRLLSMLEESGLPTPDEIEYGQNCVRFLWTDRKVAVVIDLDDFEGVAA